MKVVHIESGLGNQMLSFCEYLALKHLHPDEDIYIETIVYDIPESNMYGYAEDTKMALSSKKLESLGWTPTVDLNEAYKRLIISMNNRKI